MSFARRKVMKALSVRGFVVEREGARHTIVRGPANRKVPIPRPAEIKRGTARSIADQAGVAWPEFERDIT